MWTKNFQMSKLFRKGRGKRDQIANIRWIIEKTRELKKKKQTNKQNYLCFINYTKVFDCVDHNKLWKALTDMEIPDHFTCLLRNLYAGQAATVRILYETTKWFKIEKANTIAVTLCV